MTIDYAEGLTFTFSDENWLKKLGKAALWTFISMILFVIPLYFFVLGYGLDTARNVMQGKKHPLPELDDVGAIYKDGAKFFVVTLVYSLPIIILVCIMYAGIIGAAIAGEELDSDAIGAAAGGLGLAVQCLSSIYSIFLSLMLPAIMTKYLRTGDIRESLNVSEVFGIMRDNFVPCLMIMLMNIAAGLILGVTFMISIITICGWIFVYFAGAPWVSAVQGHLVGQFVTQLDNKSDDMNPAPTY